MEFPKGSLNFVGSVAFFITLIGKDYEWYISYESGISPKTY